MFNEEYIDSLCKEFFEELKTASPGYTSYSRTLRKSIPGKQQIRAAFIENLAEIHNLCNDKTVEDKIDAILKKYR